MKKTIVLCAILLTISGCSQAKKQVEDQTNTDAIVATSLGDSYYSVIQRNTNPDRDNYYATLSDTKDFLTIGRGLEKLASSYFSTETYYKAEGQYVKHTHRQDLLKRTNKEKSDVEYPHSIQPERGRNIDGVDNPIMVSAIYEQDFYDDNKGETLVGASFAIIIDPRDENNTPLTKPMSEEAVQSYGEEIIPKLYDYLMEEKTLKKVFQDIPIQICVYQAANKITSYVDGHYILQSYNDKSHGSIEQVVMKELLMTSEEVANIDSMTATEFLKLKTELKKLSIDAVGVIGYGKYENKTLQALTIETNINVKTYGELEFFVSRSAEVLNSAFTEVVDIKMTIKTADEMMAVVVKDKGKDVEITLLY